MWGIWDAPSDRDYYDQGYPSDGYEDEEPPDGCMECGAPYGEECGMNCPSKTGVLATWTAKEPEQINNAAEESQDAPF